jgi:lipoprotein NlpD
MKPSVSSIDRPGLRRAAAVAASALLLAACASPGHRAPVEERKVAVPRPGPAPVTPAAAVSATGVVAPADEAQAARSALPGSENAGKPGYFTVRPGDTLIRVGLESGQNWRDIARWNNIENPNLIEVGQVLRVIAPAAVETGGVSVKPVLAAGRVESRPLDGRAAASAPVASAASAAAAVAPAREGDDDPGWVWPAAGAVIAPFDEGKSKGLDIAGKAGDPVLAAADGRVVYAGSGLRGYGNLVIVKHNATFLTAYAHNQTLLVKEDQPVRRGQKIAEMGSSDAERVQLHFEIRRQGKPVDPARLLPAR